MSEWANCPAWCRGHYQKRRMRGEPLNEREAYLINARPPVSEEKLPPLSLDSSLDLILLVQLATTLADLGVLGYWLYGHCGSHGDLMEPVFTDQPPSQVSFGCRQCYRAGLQRYVAVEDIQSF